MITRRDIANLWIGDESALLKKKLSKLYKKGLFKFIQIFKFVS